jgi:hypothetical protein
VKVKKVEEAIGMVLCHDMTQIIPGKYKGVAFKKGHVIKAEDVEVLLSIGKKSIYVWENEVGMVHENDAAEILGNLCQGDFVKGTEIKEGKMNLIAGCDGLLKIDIKSVEKINNIEEIMIATRHQNFMVKKGDKLAGTRVIPLLIDEKKLEIAKEIAGENKLISILPQRIKRMGIVTTGSEIFSGRIKDAFGPVIRSKVLEYDVEVIDQIIVGDDQASIVDAIKTLEAKGAELIVCTGGMSVDPDDRTPSAIKAIGGEIISYGAPVLPGAMFLLSYKDDLTIMGLPGCVMYSERTIFDLVLPRVLCGDKITKKSLAAYGHGGLCLSCEVCTFPQCAFGKGN